MKKYKITGLIPVLTILTALAIISACHNHAHNEKEGHTHGEGTEEEAHAAENEHATTVSLTEAQMKAIGLQLGAMEQKNLTSTLKTNGYLRVPNQNKGNATTLYGGVVQTLLVQPGSLVKAGQRIATIANPQIITVQEEYLTASAKLVLLEQEYQRQMELNTGNAGALKNLQQATSELNALKTRRSSLQQQLQLMGIEPGTLTPEKMISTLAVKSPLAGVVSDVLVKIGSYVDVNVPVAEIVDNGQLHLDLFVYEQDLPRLRNNQVIHFTLTNNPGKEYDAVIYSIGTAFEPNTKTIPVHARVQGDKSGLIEGMSITAVVSLEKAMVPAVPSEAIVTDEGQDFIFLLSEQGQPSSSEKTFRKIAVHRGTTDVGYTEITPVTLLPDNARIVSKGAFFLLAKMNNKGEGHSH